MVARSPPKIKNPILDPNKIKETVNKVEKCMARLQELQYVTSGRFKHESIRIRNANSQKSPNGKLPTHIGEWKNMSLPAMLLGETVGEILEATRFAKVIVAAVESKPKKITITGGDPKTPVTESRHNSRLKPENTELNARRKREKQIIRSDIHSPLLIQRAKSRIHFKHSTSPPKKQSEKENLRFLANRVSPKNRPWARKTVIFPNPVFHSSPNSKKASTFNRPTTPHKFLIKTPPTRKGKGESLSSSSSSSVVKFQVKIRSPPTMSVSPTRHTPKKKTASPPKKVSTAAKLRRSFSPSRLASRLVSPLKSRRLSVQRASMDGSGITMMNMMSGLKQRPMSTKTTTPTPMPHLSCRRI